MRDKSNKELKTDGVLENDIHQLMTPQSIKELEDLSPTMQQFLLRWQDKRDLMLSEQLKEELKDFFTELHRDEYDKFCKDVSEIVSAQNEQMFETLNRQTVLINSLKDDIEVLRSLVENIVKKVGEHEIAIEVLKRYASTPSTLIRIALSIALGLILATIIALFIHYNLPIN
jgi:glutamyl-tRNA reductase